MENTKDGFHSIAGVPEVDEPTEVSSFMSTKESGSSSTSTNPRLSQQPSSSSIAKKLLTSQPSSATNSPRPSRESSPVRPYPRAGPSTRLITTQSRKSSKDVSPSRSTSATTTSSARTLSAATTPQLQHIHSDLSIKAPVPQKPQDTSEQRDAPRWPVSPRLKSPPPNNKALIAPRKTEQDVPSINIQRSAPVDRKPSESTEGGEETPSIAGARSPGRGASGTSTTLETVQEISQPATPAAGINTPSENSDHGSNQMTEQDNPMDQAFIRMLTAKQNKNGAESESESGGKEGVKLRATSTATASASASRPTAANQTKSYSVSGGAGRGKPSGEGSTKNMIVETETVSSIPQVAVGGGTGGNGVNGSLRAKPSSETIRPKKEKKKTMRKAPSVTSGTASSKADIFEAKIASAVDEANSSDSEETFVYESNPPEASERPRRFHSRTPSATSMMSQVDQRGNPRSVHGMMENGHTVAMKKSMKFANAYNSTPPDGGPVEDDGKGTGRSNIGTGRGTTHHHHIGRWGRNGGNGHPSLFDTESPFPNAARSKMSGNTSRQSSRPTSPRVNKLFNGGKKNGPKTSAYDMDDGAGADDERTPLIPASIRSARSVRGRRPGSSMRQLEHQAYRENQPFIARFAGCLVMSVMIGLIVCGAIGFMFGTTQPLRDVKVVAFRKVLVSQQELMLDMEVTAHNPNLVVVAIDSMNVDIFARSKHAAPDDDWWKWKSLQLAPQMRRRGDRFLDHVSIDGEIGVRDDDPKDPPEFDDPDELETLKLGQLHELEDPLTFEGSPFRYSHSEATGTLRLISPGNTTEGGEEGMERWGRVLKYEFDLRIKGVLKYQLPLSGSIKSVNIDHTTKVNPHKLEDPE